MVMSRNDENFPWRRRRSRPVKRESSSTEEALKERLCRCRDNNKGGSILHFYRAEQEQIDLDTGRPLNSYQNKCNCQDHKEKKREPLKRQRARHRIGTSHWGLSSLLMLLSLWQIQQDLSLTTQYSSPLILPVAGAQSSGDATMDFCVLYLAVSDKNRDERIDRGDEYVNFLNFITARHFQNSGVETFDQLPVQLIENFDSLAVNAQLDITGALPGVIATPEQQTHLEDICTATFDVFNQIGVALAPVAPIPAPVVSSYAPAPASTQAPVEVDFAKCRSDMTAADTVQNNALNKDEYIQFVNSLSGNDQYATATFETLPPVLQYNFNIWATDPGDGLSVPIYGASTSGTATDAQIRSLERFCETSQKALNVAGTGGTPSESTLPSDVGNNVGATPFTQCRLNMAIADGNFDSQLDEDEYVTFVYRMAGQAEPYNPDKTTFATLPAALQTNFDSLASLSSRTGQIYISGAAPGQTPSAQELFFLEKICADTDRAIVEAGGVSVAPNTGFPVSLPAPNINTNVIPTITPVLAPVVASTPGFDPKQCKIDIAFSDTSPKNSNLGEAEYVAFIKRLQNEAVVGPSFSDLPQELQANFQSLAQQSRDSGNGDGSTIYVYGVMPFHTADATQEAFLMRACMSTQEAISITFLSQPPIAPAPAPPLGLIPTATMGSVTNPAFPTTMPVYTPFTSAPVPTIIDLPTPPDSSGSPTGDSTVALGLELGPFVGVIIAIIVGSCLVCGGLFYVIGAMGDSDGGSGEKNPQTSLLNKNEAEGTDRPSGLGGDDDDDEDSESEDDDDEGGGVGYGGYSGMGDDDEFSTVDDTAQQTAPKSPKQFGSFGGPDLPMNFGTQNDEEQGGAQAASNGVAGADPLSFTNGNQTGDGFFNASGDSWGKPNGNFFGNNSNGWTQPPQEQEEASQEQDGSSSGSEEEDDEYTQDDDEQYTQEDSGEGDQAEESADDMPTPQSSPEFESDEWEQNEEQEEEEEEEEEESGSQSEESEPRSDYDDDMAEISSMLDEQIERGDWDGVAESVAESFQQGSDEESEESGSGTESFQQGSDEESKESGSGTEFSEADDYREEVEELVRRVIPDEAGNIDAMLEQFEGREQELINTLLAMEERGGGRTEEASEGEYSDGESYDGEEQESYGSYSQGSEVDASFADEGESVADSYAQGSVSEQDGSGSFYSNEDGGSLEEGSYMSDEGSGSYYDENDDGRSYSGSEASYE